MRGLGGRSIEEKDAVQKRSFYLYHTALAIVSLRRKRGLGGKDAGRGGVAGLVGSAVMRAGGSNNEPAGWMPEEQAAFLVLALTKLVNICASNTEEELRR
jgi:hypothetical protein